MRQRTSTRSFSQCAAQAHGAEQPWAELSETVSQHKCFFPQPLSVMYLITARKVTKTEGCSETIGAFLVTDM